MKHYAYGRIALLCCVCLLAGCAASPQACSVDTATWREEPRIGELFAQAGVNGTFVLYDREQSIMRGCNHARAETRYQPASTFKILNSLIAFETGVVRNEEELQPYGGEPQTIKAWAHDMNIREAIAVSNVPLYQGIARRIGLQRMRDFVRRAGYGNADIGDKVDDFWLQGPLAISALEQVRFLETLLQRQLPFSGRSLDLLREIMPRETLPEGEVSFKTGWSRNTQPGVGWIVGWVRHAGKAYPFALNLDLPRPEDAPLRLRLMREVLQRIFQPRA